MNEIKELSIEEFTRYITRLVAQLGNITLENPDTEETFPVAVISNPMQSIKKTENNIPIYVRFSISIEWWTNSKYESMNLFQETNKLLRQHNLAQIGNPIDLYDQITKKHRYGGRYEVNYNGLTNSLERVI